MHPSPDRVPPNSIADTSRPSPAISVLAWLLARGEDILPIPGTKHIARLEENAGAARVKLSADDVARIDEAMPPGAAAGSRYPDAQMKSVHL